MLERVEQGGPARAGAWRFGAGATPAGLILVEEQRVCWATAPGGRRLTDVLVEEIGVPAETVRQIYQRCQREGTPLGQALVAEGVLADRDLRAALVRQTAEAVVLLASAPEPPSWISHRAGSYLPQFTFSAVEVAAHAAAFATGGRVAERGDTLGALLSGGGWGAAFSPGAPALPVALAGEAPPALGDVLALGGWAQRALASWQARRGEPRLIAWWFGDGAAVAWHDADGPCAAMCCSAAAASRLLARLLRSNGE